MTAKLNSPVDPKENGLQYRHTPSPQHIKKLPTMKLRMTLSPTNLRSLTSSPTRNVSSLPLATWRRSLKMTFYASFLSNKKLEPFLPPGPFLTAPSLINSLMKPPSVPCPRTASPPMLGPTPNEATLLYMLRGLSSRMRCTKVLYHYHALDQPRGYSK